MGPGHMIPSMRSTATRAPDLPPLGETVFRFRLRSELGRGAFARVFLAEQGDLAGRPVVLKCTTIEGSEPQTLAQLQHTNIVPIYSAHEDREAGLRAVCMPYFGGATLSRVLQVLWGKAECPLQGAELVEALEAVGGGREPSPGPSDFCTPPSAPKPVDLLRNISYVRAVAWLIA